MIKSHLRCLKKHWNYTNWGTKWDAIEPIVEVTDEEIIITCDTAWDAPIYWAETAAKKFNINIVIEYEEPNNAFAGCCRADPDNMYNDIWDIQPDDSSTN